MTDIQKKNKHSDLIGYDVEFSLIIFKCGIYFANYYIMTVDDINIRYVNTSLGYKADHKRHSKSVRNKKLNPLNIDTFLNEEIKFNERMKKGYRGKERPKYADSICHETAKKIFEEKANRKLKSIQEQKKISNKKDLEYDINIFIEDKIKKIMSFDILLNNKNDIDYKSAHSFIIEKDDNRKLLIRGSWVGKYSQKEWETGKLERTMMMQIEDNDTNSIQSNDDLDDEEKKEASENMYDSFSIRSAMQLFSPQNIDNKNFTLFLNNLFNILDSNNLKIDRAKQINRFIQSAFGVEITKLTNNHEISFGIDSN